MFRGFYRKEFLLPFLTQCVPDLERFEIPHLNGDYFQTLKETLRHNCPNLQHLSTTRIIDGHESYPPTVQYTIEAVSTVTTGLRSFSCSYWDPSEQVLESLLNRHAGTLERVDFFQSCRSPRMSTAVQQILVSCSNLKWFRVTGVGLDVSNVGTATEWWSCLDMRDLVIQLALGNKAIQMTRALKGLQRSSRGFIVSLGLTRLEYLTFESNDREMERLNVAWSFTLDPLSGCLDKLTDLRALRHLSLPIEICLRIGQAEVEFMDKRWPVLRRFTMIDGYGVDQRDRQNIIASAAWL